MYFFLSDKEIESIWQPEKKMTTAIVLLSGIGADESLFHVLEGGKTLELTVAWQRALLDTFIMHKKWLLDENVGRIGSIEKYHPKVVGFEEALQDLRTRFDEKKKGIVSLRNQNSVTNITVKALMQNC